MRNFAEQIRGIVGAEYTADPEESRGWVNHLEQLQCAQTPLWEMLQNVLPSKGDEPSPSADFAEKNFARLNAVDKSVQQVPGYVRDLLPQKDLDIRLKNLGSLYVKWERCIQIDDLGNDQVFSAPAISLRMLCKRPQNDFDSAAHPATAFSGADAADASGPNKYGQEIWDFWIHAVEQARLVQSEDPAPIVAATRGLCIAVMLFAASKPHFWTQDRHKYALQQHLGAELAFDNIPLTRAFQDKVKGRREMLEKMDPKRLLGGMNGEELQYNILEGWK